MHGPHFSKSLCQPLIRLEEWKGGIASRWQAQRDSETSVPGNPHSSSVPGNLSISSKGSYPASYADKMRARKLRYGPSFEKRINWNNSRKPGRLKDSSKTLAERLSSSALSSRSFKKHIRPSLKNGFDTKIPRKEGYTVEYTNSMPTKKNWTILKSFIWFKWEKKEFKPLYNLGEDVCRVSREQSEKALVNTR